MNRPFSAVEKYADMVYNIINYIISEVFFLDIRAGDRVELKKPHPCGNKVFTVLRVGMDFKIRCESCGREAMVPRNKIEKNIKKVLE